MAPKATPPKPLTDEEWHETNIKVYLLTESGPGKSDAWNWGEGFPDAPARWIAAEVDLWKERLGSKDKNRAVPVTVKVLSYWENDGKEHVRITFPDGGSLMVKLTRLCGLDNPPSSILLEIQVEIAGTGTSRGAVRLRPNYSPEYHVVGQIVHNRQTKENYKMRILRSLKVGECR
jgi:hypothetical protein